MPWNTHTHTTHTHAREGIRSFRRRCASSLRQDFLVLDEVPCVCARSFQRRQVGEKAASAGVRDSNNASEASPALHAQRETPFVFNFRGIRARARSPKQRTERSSERRREVPAHPRIHTHTHTSRERACSNTYNVVSVAQLFHDLGMMMMSVSADQRTPRRNVAASIVTAVDATSATSSPSFGHVERRESHGSPPPLF